MLPLAGSDLPTSADQLTSALRDGLANLGLESQSVRANGNWPHLDELAVDLTKAHATRSLRLSPSNSKAAAQLSVASLRLHASPLFFEQLPVHVELKAQGARLGLHSNPPRNASLELEHADAGTVMIAARRNDLEEMLKGLAGTAASKQGAEIKSVALSFTSRGPRALDFRADVAAKVFIMSAKLIISGKLEVDEQLNLRFSDLDAAGNGVLASLASNALRPQFATLEKRVIALSAFSWAGVRLHDVQLSGGDSLRLSAEFAG